MGGSTITPLCREGGVVSSPSLFKEDAGGGNIAIIPLENKEVGCGVGITISLLEEGDGGWHHHSSL